ncbi:MAG TPA: bifunctional hydroxymethylpyrimidine kinase/phosphomethylpyrimidine kinase [Caulobacteraceae bacterium]|nr:bifunctional hydroxymethylpyrimidine kinase/phosphomethylpyrimidine kinase [Caulobacteraceae bacterium]
MIGRVLAIGGSDPSGGAGIQADIKTITALGGYAATAITAITVQDTTGVMAVHAVPADVVVAQARAALDDVGADAIKTGMLGSAATVEAVADLLSGIAAPIVVDPVLASTSGAALLEPSAFDLFKRRVLPLATLLTPNAPEAERLTSLRVATTADLRRAGEALLTAGVRAVLMKGGHVAGESVTDLLMSPDGEIRFTSPRIETGHGHGTGCTLASASATGLAQGLPLAEAVGRAHAYVAEALRRAPGFGVGRGPLDHAWPLRDR